MVGDSLLGVFVDNIGEGDDGGDFDLNGEEGGGPILDGIKTRSY